MFRSHCGWIHLGDNMRFDKYLTPEERVQAWRSGLTYKLASSEILPSEFNAMCKKAGSTADTAALPFKAMLWAALLSGGALGSLQFFADEAVSNGSAKNMALRRRRNYFRDVAARLKQEIEDDGQEEEIANA